MQSWQTDLLNLYFGVAVKPLLRRVKSIGVMRGFMAVTDATGGRLSIPKNTQREPVEIPRAKFQAEWVTHPGDNQQRIILYLPGGAYILRSPNLHTAMLSRLCDRAAAKGLLVHYRLAPEHPFPACLEDSLLAYRWLLKQGYAPQQIVIAGDSAGGGLTLSTLLAIRDEGLPLPACALMMSPLLDSLDTSASRWNNAQSDKMLPAAWERAADPRAMVIGDADPKNPLISPIYGDLTDLPALYIQVSDSELLLDDSLRLARRGHMYQVDVKVDIWRKTPHVWQALAFLPESTEALQKSAEFIKKHIAQSAVELPDHKQAERSGRVRGEAGGQS